MKNYFIGGSATVDMFNGSELFATSKTMINNTINIDVSEQEVRAGEGAGLRGMYYHSSSFGLKFEDAMFKLDYIAKNIGSSITLGGDVIHTEQVTLGAGGAGTVSDYTPTNFGDYGVVGWANITGESATQTVTFTGSNFTFAGGNSGDKVCVKYFYVNTAGRKLIVGSNIIPDTINIVMTASLFAGEQGSETKVGTVQINVPRFQLMGTTEIALAMDGVSTTPLEGKALVVDLPGCAEDGYYATIIENLNNTNWYDNVTALAISGGDFDLDAAATQTLDVRYVTSEGYTGKVLNYSDLTFVSGTVGTATIDSAGVVTGVAAGDSLLTATITAKPDIDVSATVTVA